MDAANPSELPPPTVVVSELDIIYRIMGSSKMPAPDEGSLVRRALQRGKSVGQVHEVHAVKNVSFVARRGESIGIVGLNGSGKSTLLRAVAGLIPPNKGRVWVEGQPSLLGVNAVLMPKLSGERNIYIGGQALGLTKEQIRERFDDIVEFSGIGDSVYLPMRTYSSGMAARLRFAISTAATPEILMIDEALATGDAQFRERSQERIEAIRQDAGTVFLVSHSAGTIRETCDRAMWMEKGHLIADGPVNDVMDAYAEANAKRKAASAAAAAAKKKKAAAQAKE